MLDWLTARAGIAIALGVLAVAVVGCGETVIDDTKTEEQLTANREKETGDKVSEVDCPSDVQVDVGRTFECTIVTSKGQRETATLKITNEAADLTLLSVKPSGQ